MQVDIEVDWLVLRRDHYEAVGECRWLAKLAATIIPMNPRSIATKYEGWPEKGVRKIFLG
jgi:hypothetical protein